MNIKNLEHNRQVAWLTEVKNAVRAQIKRNLRIPLQYFNVGTQATVSEFNPDLNF